MKKGKEKRDNQEIKKLKKKNRKINYVLFVFCLILIIYSIWLWTNKPLETRILEAKFIIGENIGVNLNPGELNFGKLTPGDTMIRSVYVKNEHEFPIKLKIFVDKDIIDFITVEPRYTLLPEENVSIPFILRVPKETSFGYYSGEVKFEFRKV